MAALARGDWPAVGGLLTASHASLRDDYEVSVPRLDVAVEVALRSGALGARLTGGSFGGSAIALVPRDRAAATASAIEGAYARAGWRAPTCRTVQPADGGLVLSGRA